MNLFLERLSTHINTELGKLPQLEKLQTWRNSNPNRYEPIPSPTETPVELEFSEGDLRLPPYKEVQLRWIGNMQTYFSTLIGNNAATVLPPIRRMADCTTNMDVVIDLSGQTIDPHHFISNMTLIPGDGPSMQSQGIDPLYKIQRVSLDNVFFEKETVSFMLQTDRLRKLDIIHYLRPEGISDEAWRSQLNKPNTLRRLNHELSDLLDSTSKINIVSPEDHNIGPLLNHYHHLHQTLIAPKKLMSRSDLLDKIDEYAKSVLLNEGRQQMPSMQIYQTLIKTLLGDLVNQNRLAIPYDPPVTYTPVTANHR